MIARWVLTRIAEAFDAAAMRQLRRSRARRTPPPQTPNRPRPSGPVRGDRTPDRPESP